MKQPDVGPKDPKSRETYLEFVEKQVILDVLFDPYVQQSFIQYDVFPFSEKGFLGNETALLNVITFWKHYWHKYMDQLSKATILEDEYEKYLQKQGVIIEDDDFSDLESEQDSKTSLGQDML